MKNAHFEKGSEMKVERLEMSEKEYALLQRILTMNEMVIRSLCAPPFIVTDPSGKGEANG